MAIGLYLDVHVPIAVTAGLHRQGIDVVTSQDDDTRELADDALIERANDQRRLLVTQDDDLLKIAADWQMSRRSFVGIVYVHQLGPSVGRMIEDLELLSLYAEPGELANLVTYLPLR